jgi:hydrogenase maturation protein HypF
MLSRLERDKPPRAVIQSFESWWLDPLGFAGFEIRHSDAAGEKTVLVLPDIATCHECEQEVFDPADRRYLYPFTNCTNCGPRYTIIQGLPYDRANTTMRGFEMCPECRAEYEDPSNRRFHAQPNACPTCGPQIELWAPDGSVLSRREEAMQAAAGALIQGRVVAVKGLGGFHLMVPAADAEAVRRLRERKLREHKPLAVMAPDIAIARELCEVGVAEERALCAPEAPIVLMASRPGVVAPNVAPGNPYLGVMLPYTPLHKILLRLVGKPLVATSGNLSDEPICTDEREALERLRGVADLFLVHDRPICRHVDDSIVRIVAGGEMVLRRARGFAPLPLPLGRDEGRGTRDEGLEIGGKEGGGEAGQLGNRAGLDLGEAEQSARERTRSHVASPHAAEGRAAQTPDPRPETLPPSPCFLAVGAHLKNSVALSHAGQAFVSQHIGDLETPEAANAFRRVIRDLEGLFDLKPVAAACDLHPDYLSSRYARESGMPIHEVQHHYAHVLACMADNDLRPPVLGVSWDGTGLGVDGTVWGGEFIRVTDEGWERFGHIRSFSLPGGDKAAREPRRSALGVLWEIGAQSSIADGFEAAEYRTLCGMLEKGINCPRTSSMGRLFDAVAALAGLRDRSRFEGEAAMALEFACGEGAAEPYDMSVSGEPNVLDWEPAIRRILADVAAGRTVAEVSASFHAALAYGIVRVARAAGARRVLLTGGCFQNKRLLENAMLALADAGFSPYRHQRVPPNDGGIALGQLVAIARERARS